MGESFEDDLKAIAQDVNARRFDDHGQPRGRGINARLRVERDIAELLGIAKGLLADGRIVEEEARYLHQWGAHHRDALMRWPASLLFTRVRQMFVDNRIDEAERLELQEVLSAFVGGEMSITLGYEGAAELPLDQPAPLVCWQGEVYVFTGKFAYGTWRQCQFDTTGGPAARSRDVGAAARAQI